MRVKIERIPPSAHESCSTKGCAAWTDLSFVIIGPTSDANVGFQFTACETHLWQFARDVADAVSESTQSAPRTPGR